MAATFTNISLGAIELIMMEIGALEIKIEGTKEYVYERNISSAKTGKEFPYKLRIYSSIDVRGDVCRKKGKDAIRLCLVDKETNKIIKVQKRVNRTGSDIANRIKSRARELYGYALTPANYCNCGKLMVVRKAKKGPNAGNKFLGCSDYPNCYGTKNL